MSVFNYTPIPIYHACLTYTFHFPKTWRRAVYIRASESEELLDALCLLAERHTLPERPLPTLVDPDDEPLVHLAVGAKVPHLITHNVRHLMPANAQGINVVTPGQFLGIMKRI